MFLLLLVNRYPVSVIKTHTLASLDTDLAATALNS